MWRLIIPLDLVEDIGSPWLGLNVDTVHLAHARGDFYENLREAVRSDKLFHLHLSELNRAEWGTGMLGQQTPQIFDVLKREGYQGTICLENFCDPLKAMLQMWEQDPGERTELQVLQRGAEYVRDNGRYIVTSSG